MTQGPEGYELYGDQPAASQPSEAGHPPVCAGCGSPRFEEGFVESASEGLVRWFSGPREEGIFGVRRFGLDRRTVIARRCLDCSRLELYAGELD